MNSIIGFFTLWILKLISRLPSSPFDYDDVMDDIDSILGYVNWFIPFNIFSQVFNVWCVCFFACLIILLVVRWVIKAKSGA